MAPNNFLWMFGVWTTREPLQKLLAKQGFGGEGELLAGIVVPRTCNSKEEYDNER